MREELEQDADIIAHIKAIELTPDNSALWRSMGMALSNLGRIDEALDAIRNALQLTPDDPLALLNRAAILNSMGQRDEALASSVKATEVDPNNSVAWRNRGIFLVLLGRFEDALAAFVKATELTPGDALPWRYRNEALHELGRYDEALNSATMATRLDPHNPLSWTHRAGTLFKLDRFDEALEDVDKAILLAPNNQTFWNDKAILLDVLGRYDEALGAQSKSVQLAPEEARGWINEGLLLSRVGRPYAAIRASSKAVHLDTLNPLAWRNRASDLIALLRYNEALQALVTLTELTPMDQAVWHDKGYVLFQLARYAEAIEAFDRKIALAPDDTAGWLNKALALNALGHYEEAVKAFAQAADRAPTDGNIWLKKGLALNCLGLYEEALRAFAKATELIPEDGRAWSEKALALDHVGLCGQALVASEAGVTFAPGDPAVWKNHQLILSSLGRCDESATSADKVLALTPNDPRAWLSKGFLMSALGWREEALRAFTKATDLAPGESAGWRSKALVLEMLGRSQQAQEAQTHVFDEDVDGTPIKKSDASDIGRSRSWLPRPLRLIVSKSMREANEDPEVTRQREKLLDRVQALAANVTYDLGLLYAGHQPQFNDVDPAVVGRLLADAEPFLDQGSAVVPNFGDLGELQASMTDETISATVSFVSTSILEDVDGNWTPIDSRPVRVELQLDSAATRIQDVSITRAPLFAASRFGPPRDTQGTATPATAPLAPPPWRICHQPSCRGATVLDTETCFGHIGELEQDLLLDGLPEAQVFDCRGVTFSLALLGRLVSAIRSRESRRKMPTMLFNDCVFEDDADFRNVEFHRRVDFTACRFEGRVFFSNAHFREVADFSRSQFASGADFDRIATKGEFRLSDARLSGFASFNGAIFENDAWFRRLSCVGVSFLGATFRRHVHFEDSQFGGPSPSSAGAFISTAEFAGAQFMVAQRIGPITVVGELGLDNAHFHSRAVIELSALSLSCHGTRFAGGVDLRVRWAEAVLDETYFGDPSVVRRLESTSPGESTVEECVKRVRPWMAGNPHPRVVSLRSSSVRGLTLTDVDLRPCWFRGAHGLDGLRIEGDVLWPMTPQRWWWTRRLAIAEEHVLRRQRYQIKEHPRRPGEGVIATVTPVESWREKGWLPPECRPSNWSPQVKSSLGPEEVGGIYRLLRKGREDQKDEPNGADFYFGEMEMRRLAAQRGRTSRVRSDVRYQGERLLLGIYWLVAGYALRPRRVIVTFLLLLLFGGATLAVFGLKTNAPFLSPPGAFVGWPTRLGAGLLSSVEAATSIIRTPDTGRVNAVGEVIVIPLRLIGPLFLALLGFAVRSRVKR